MNVISPDDLACGLLNADMLRGALEDTAHLNGILPVYKEWGDTPLQTLEKLRVQYPSLKDATLSYAGRLDPLAEGLMLVLVGEANKEREKFLGLSKRYEVEVLFGIGTDSGDIFGIPKLAQSDSVHDDSHSIACIPPNEDSENSENFDKILNTFLGKHHFDYPLYSSKTVQGKPLHQWVNEGRVSEIEIPKTDIEIFSIKNLGIRQVGVKEILEKVQKAITTVKGDFRFEQIESSWKKLLGENEEFNKSNKDAQVFSKNINMKTFSVLKIECDCSSGTYMRTLAEEIGKKRGTSALAYSIRRTKVGDIEFENSSSIKKL